LKLRTCLTYACFRTPSPVSIDLLKGTVRLVTAIIHIYAPSNAQLFNEGRSLRARSASLPPSDKILLLEKIACNVILRKTNFFQSAYVDHCYRVVQDSTVERREDCDASETPVVYISRFSDAKLFFLFNGCALLE